MTHPLSATRVLPPLATLHTCTATSIGGALQTLRDLYFTHVPSTKTPRDAVPVFKQSLLEVVPAIQPKRMMHLSHRDRIPDSGYASAEDDQEEDENETREIQTKNTIDKEEEEEGLDRLCSDELERSYAIRWLTGLVKRGDGWAFGSEEDEVRVARLEDASRLLSRFASHDVPEEALTRTFVFSFHTPACRRHGPGDDASAVTTPIKVELNDAPVDGTDHTAVGLQSWGSAIVLAERMCSDPETYFGALHPCASIPTFDDERPRRVLELGAGTGLLSITAGQIFSRTQVQCHIDATDYHPSVLENLARNVRHNLPSAAGDVSMSVQKLDWCLVTADVSEGAYDVVFAADVVYHPEHALWIRGCVERRMREDGVFWLMMPVRTVGRHKGLVNIVEEVFPFVGALGTRTGEGELGPGCPGGKRLAVVTREEVDKVDRVGRADEGGYILFEIRWA